MKNQAFCKNGHPLNAKTIRIISDVRYAEQQYRRCALCDAEIMRRTRLAKKLGYTNFRDLLSQLYRDL